MKRTKGLLLPQRPSELGWTDHVSQLMSTQNNPGQLYVEHAYTQIT